MADHCSAGGERKSDTETDDEAFAPFFESFALLGSEREKNCETKDCDNERSHRNHSRKAWQECSQDRDIERPARESERAEEPTDRDGSQCESRS